ncbi:MAG: hypothetical protein EOP86_25410 [Verrucomicrobiaceae bacterium]|nr:MAG: hypothetical protein EOP86_25410 [Verrucomicrobiaceae bacterium]
MNGASIAGNLKITPQPQPGTEGVQTVAQTEKRSLPLKIPAHKNGSVTAQKIQSVRTGPDREIDFVPFVLVVDFDAQSMILPETINL